MPTITEATVPTMNINVTSCSSTEQAVQSHQEHQAMMNKLDRLISMVADVTQGLTIIHDRHESLAVSVQSIEYRLHELHRK